MHIDNYLKCKWINCTNQMTETGWVDENVHVCSVTYHITLLKFPNSMYLFYTVRLIMFPLWLAIVIIFYFLSGYWLWKLISIFYYCDYVTIIHLISLYHNWSAENNRMLYHEVKWSCSVVSDSFCHSMDCSLPGFSVHGIFQARVLSGLPFPSPGDLPDPGIGPRSPAL